MLVVECVTGMRAVGSVKLAASRRKGATPNAMQARSGDGFLQVGAPANCQENLFRPWERKQIAIRIEHPIGVNEYEIRRTAQSDSIAAKTFVVSQGRLEIAPRPGIVCSSEVAGSDLDRLLCPASVLEHQSPSNPRRASAQLRRYVGWVERQQRRFCWYRAHPASRTRTANIARLRRAWFHGFHR